MREGRAEQLAGCAVCAVRHDKALFARELNNRVKAEDAYLLCIALAAAVCATWFLPMAICYNEVY